MLLINKTFHGYFVIIIILKNIKIFDIRISHFLRIQIKFVDKNFDFIQN